MTKNAYIHVPFCVKKCNYCAFTSFNKLLRKSDYVDALFKEIKEKYKGEELNTLYFGGGTPSLLSIDDVKKIMSCFNFENCAEITFEVNPNKLKVEYLRSLYDLGVNRLSIGAQSFDNEILKIIGRLHTLDDIKLAVKSARVVGFNNISLDLIYGLPSQSLQNFENSLKQAIALNIEHISLYGLKIEEGTVFAKQIPENLPDDDMQADMYLLATDVLCRAGYEKYEISNFAKRGFYSRHNLNYWNANTYYGFGCGAHGYEDDCRYENQIDLEEYIKNPLIKLANTKITQQEKIEEEIFLGFRKAEGINVKRLIDIYGYDFETINKDKINLFLENDYIFRTQDGYALSDKGFLLSNEILCEFLIM